MDRKQTHLMYGGLTGLALVIFGLVLHVVDLSLQPWVQWAMYGIFLVGVILNAFAFSKANEGFVTFGATFSSGFKTSAIITIVTLAWVLISMMIFPEMKEKGLEMARQSMEQRGMAEEQIDKGLEMTKEYYTVFAIGGVVFGYMFFGAIFSLIGAAVAPKKGDKPMISE
jgi:hypothetical protein